MKECKRCKNLKPYSSFNKSDQSADGFRYYCKDCYRLIDRKRYERNRISRIEQSRKWREENRAEYILKQRARHFQDKKRASELNKIWYLKHRGAGKAKWKVQKAIEKGLLKRSPCEVCGELETMAHHDDYNKPLDIRWLCRKHHSRWHSENEPVLAS